MATLPQDFELGWLSVAETTRKRYLSSVLRFVFVSWAADNFYFDDFDNLDGACTAYANDCFRRRGGVGRQDCANLQHGLSLLMPACKGKLVRLAQALRGWSKVARKRPWLPITREMTAMIATSLARAGRKDIGTAVLVMFSGMLRISEAVNLLVGDVAFAGDARMPSLSQRFPAYLSLRNTKTRDIADAPVRHPDVAALLRDHLANRPLQASAKVFPFSADTLRRHFRSACDALGFSSRPGSPRLVPHGLRHGGATDMHFAMGASLDDVLHAGRWAATSSARHYIQAAKALAVDLVVSAAAAATGAFLWTHLLVAFSRAAASATGYALQRPRSRA